ncbi:MAG: nucleotidyltransferase family protein [Deltaproteobacteria bacterium]|nr:nucleotidyltransferase family protein [Deltaproteobacteria bacterium]
MDKQTTLIDPTLNTTAVILAGGLGTRLRGVVSDRPKVLAEVNGRPFLEYLLDQVIETGIRKVVLCTGYMAEQIEDLFGDNYRSLQISYSREQALLGTAGALRFALPKVTTDTVFVMNGDSYCEFDFEVFAAQHFASTAKASILLKKIDSIQRYGQVHVDSNNRIMSFEEKGLNDGVGWINAGIYLLSTSLLREVPLGRNVSLEREIFPTWIGKEFYGVPQESGAFIDIGTPSSLIQAQQMFARACSTSGEIKL